MKKVMKKKFENDVSDLEDDDDMLDATQSYSRRSSSPKKVKNRSMESQHQSDTDSDATSRSRVTVLQDICLTPESKTPRAKLKKLYPDLKPIESPADLKLSDSDEIYLFRAPKNVNPNLFKKVEINLDGECRINLGDKFTITSTKVPDPTLVVSSNSRVLHFQKNIIMEKYIKYKKEPVILIPEKKSVPLPENLKNRHPLFGSEYHQKIRLSEHVEKKLDDAITNFLKRQEKLQKKKNKKKHKEKEQEPDQEIFNLLNVLPSTDRIKKETSDDSAFGSSCSTDNIDGKKKKDKKNVTSRSIKHEIEECTDDATEQTKKSMKKKKSKVLPDLDWLNVTGIKKEIEDSNPETEEASTSSKKKRRHSLTVISSTLTSDITTTPTFDPDISTILSEPPSSTGRQSKKSKKNKKPSDVIDIKKEELIHDLLNNETLKLITPLKPKKKRKHKVEEDEEDLSKTIKLEF